MGFWDFVHKNSDGLGLLAFCLILAFICIGLVIVIKPSEKIRLEQEKTRQIELTNKCNDHEEKEKE